MHGRVQKLIRGSDIFHCSFGTALGAVFTELVLAKKSYHNRVSSFAANTGARDVA